MPAKKAINVTSLTGRKGMKRSGKSKTTLTEGMRTTAPVVPLIMPVTLHDLFLWHEKLKAKNGYMVLSKHDRKIIDILVEEKAKTMGNGPRNPPRVPGDNPRA